MNSPACPSSICMFPTPFGATQERARSFLSTGDTGVLERGIPAGSCRATRNSFEWSAGDGEDDAGSGAKNRDCFGRFVFGPNGCVTLSALPLLSPLLTVGYKEFLRSWKRQRKTRRNGRERHDMP